MTTKPHLLLLWVLTWLLLFVAGSAAALSGAFTQANELHLCDAVTHEYDAVDTRCGDPQEGAIGEEGPYDAVMHLCVGVVEPGAEPGYLLVPRGTTGLDPSPIRFSQSSVSGVEEIAQSMRVRGWQGAPIDVVRLPDGTLVSVDNTRLLAAHRAGIEVRAVVHEAGEALPSGFAQRFMPRSGAAPQTWGEAVLNRINSQNRMFSETYPQGAPLTGSSQ